MFVCGGDFAGWPAGRGSSEGGDVHEVLGSHLGLVPRKAATFVRLVASRAAFGSGSRPVMFVWSGVRGPFLRSGSAVKFVCGRGFAGWPSGRVPPRAVMFVCGSWF